jgi:hypothetical protein
MVLPNPTTSPASKPPTFAHELVIAQFHSIFQKQLVALSPVFGSVVGKTAQQIVVKPDTETASWRASFLAGTDFKPGARVVIVQTQGGAPVVLGIIPRSFSDEQVIGDEQIQDGAITHEKLAPIAVESDNIRDNHVLAKHIGTGVLSSVHFPNGEIPGSWLKSGTVNYVSFDQDTKDVVNPATISGGRITAQTITRAQITQKQFARIAAENLEDNCIAVRHLQDLCVDAPNIGNSQISWEKLNGDVQARITAGFLHSQKPHPKPKPR